jgi:hypothetical protein
MAVRTDATTGVRSNIGLGSGETGWQGSIACGLWCLPAGCSAPASACNFNTDCARDLRCVKAPGRLEGVCSAGLFPGNNDDRVPVRPLFAYLAVPVNARLLDRDCDPGSRCRRERSLFGSCVRK